jgi:hypothetical protein
MRRMVLLYLYFHTLPARPPSLPSFLPPYPMMLSVTTGSTADIKELRQRASVEL